MRRICITLRQVPFKGPKKAASASPVDIFLPCPALRPHVCLGLHKGLTGARTKVGAARRRRGLRPTRPLGRPSPTPRQLAPGWGPPGGAGGRRGGALPSRSLRPMHPTRPSPSALLRASSDTTPAHSPPALAQPPQNPDARHAARRRGPQRGMQWVGRDTRGPGPGRETAVLGATPRLESPSTRQSTLGSRRTQIGPRDSGGAP